MLQRLTEDLEYSELLDRAARCDSSLEQMCLVAAFSVSSYSTTVHRTAKPFNPLLGETYELDRLEEYGYRSICEQVRRGLTQTFCFKYLKMHRLYNKRALNRRNKVCDQLIPLTLRSVITHQLLPTM